MNILMTQENLKLDELESALPFPNQSRTKVSTTLDFDKEGKQVCTLNIPFSRNTSAWGRVMIPIVQFKNGDGPTVLLIGGVHGDEFEGPVVLSKIVQRLKVERIKGRIIIVPALNLPAHLATSRISPLDNKDLNRSFPGKRNGSITSVIAHYVTNYLISRADYVLDIHSGGTSLDFVPSVVIHQLEDESQMNKTMDAMKAFGAPYGLVLEELDSEGLLDTTVERAGKVFLSTELSGAGMVSPFAVEVGDNGVRNFLKHIGVADLRKSPYTNYSCKKTQSLLTIPGEDYFYSATEDGLYEPLVELGQEIKTGQTIGQLHFLANLGRKPREIKSLVDGVMIARRVQGRAQTGDCVAVLGSPWS